jgi:hypothetical protein
MRNVRIGVAQDFHRGVLLHIPTREAAQAAREQTRVLSRRLWPRDNYIIGYV